MPKAASQNMTEQQRKWFASVRDGLHRDMGKSLAGWIAIAKKCPQPIPVCRLRRKTEGWSERL